MTRREREDLAKLVRRREHVAKSGVRQRALTVLADFEQQLAAIYESDDEQWSAITRRADETVREADAQIAALCRERGVPEQFRPSLNLSWYGRGVNASTARRAELRK